MILKILHWLCRIFIAVVFIYSGYIKVQGTLQFAVALTGYKLIPDQFILPIATYFPWVEIILGIGILIGWKIRYFAAGASALLFFFIAILTVTYFRGIEASCGCFSFDDPITPLTILRDGLIILPAVYLFLESRIRSRFVK
jgi:putative oxidoreductase